jgi:hypothetical protein
MAAKIAAEAAMAAPFKVGTKEVYLYGISCATRNTYFEY